MELEKWMLALRLDEGFPENWLATSAQKRSAEVLEQKGLLELHPNSNQKYRLTAKGFALSDQVIRLLA
jgi:hypothetical protein